MVHIINYKTINGRKFIERRSIKLLFILDDIKDIKKYNINFYLILNFV